MIGFPNSSAMNYKTYLPDDIVSQAKIPLPAPTIGEGEIRTELEACATIGFSCYF